MLRITLVAHPGARHERIELQADNSLAVWVRAKPRAGLANAAIEMALAAALKLRPYAVKIVSGAGSRRKIVEIDLPTQEVLRDRLLAYVMRLEN